MFRKYDKIHRLGKEETEGILEGECYISEKIDGANASIWIEEGKICCGSRNRKLTSNVSEWEENRNNGFNGFLQYVKEHKGIIKFLNNNPHYRLYGEWLVKHTINYDKENYKHFYLFDIQDVIEEINLQQPIVFQMADQFEIKRPQSLGRFDDPELEGLEKLVGKSELGLKGEGIVIKNLNFVNKFGNTCYAKIVAEKFKEENQIVFGNNRKYSEHYWEQYICNKYITETRVVKVAQKIESEIGVLDFKDIPRVSDSVYHDMITEEVWAIAKKVTGSISFKVLKNICVKKSILIFKEYVQQRSEEKGNGDND